MIAIFTAWYTIGVTSFGLRGSLEFSLWGGCWAGELGMGSPCGTGGSPGPFHTTNAMLPSLVCAVVALLLYLGSALMGFGRKVAPRAAGVLSLMAAAASIIGPLALASSMGPAVAGVNVLGMGGGGGFGPGPHGPDGTFAGSFSTNGGFFAPVTVDWGPGAGFYLSWIAAFFGLIAGISALLGRPGDVPIRPPTPYMQPVMFAPMMYGPPPGYGYPPPAYGYGAPPAYGYGAPPAYGYGPPPGYGMPQAYPPPPAPAPPQYIVCPACGTANPQGARMCTSCFAALGA